jgi:hypothetical protein
VTFATLRLFLAISNRAHVDDDDPETIASGAKAGLGPAATWCAFRSLQERRALSRGG